ncbi:MAG: SUMF1/EgtB/PvdO family nonheme iron enzyme [Vicinamibacterales bacterium]
MAAADRPQLDAVALRDRYARVRARTRELFALVTDEAYYLQPIALRHPIVFYEGHLPAFSFNTLVKRALGGSPIDEGLERLFARGIDPDERQVSPSESRAEDLWPTRDQVRAFADEADRRVLEALGRADLDRPGDPFLDRAEAVFAILEHEAMHQETLLYLWHRLPYELKRRPSSYRPQLDGTAPAVIGVDVPGGRATLGVDASASEFTWDNERPSYRVEVPAFTIDRDNVTNVAFLAFVDDGGYQDPRWWEGDDWAWIQEEGRTHPPFWDRSDGDWWWHGLFDRVLLPAAWPVYVTHAEASAYARWRGARLPSEAEFQRAAYGSPDGERPFPWGSEPPTPARGVFDFTSWDPEPAGSHPLGASAWGIHDLVGNGWEWTSTVFGPFPGFTPLRSYPEYSADFFDGRHRVLKGASPVTARELLRPTFRNWFRRRYPHVYGSFRCVSPR